MKLDKQRIDWSLYVITDRAIAAGRDLIEVVAGALRGGATLVQLRAKAASTAEMVALGRRLHAVTQAADVPLIVNDRIDVALAIDAEGVHVGPPDDMPADAARRLLGPERLLGVSAESARIAEQAYDAGADYVGVGDVFGTSAKADAGDPIGLEGLRAVVSVSRLPVVGIGGIDAENAGAVIQAGAAGVALISAVIGAQDPEAAARDLRRRIDRARTG